MHDRDLDHDADLRRAFIDGAWLGALLGLVLGSTGLWALSEALAAVSAVAP